MNWSFRRQLAYFLIIFGTIAIVAGVIIYRVFFAVTPTCFDRKQNQDERGIDCGGSCQLVCKEDSSSFIVRWAQATPVTEDVYNVVAYVENQNVAAGVASIGYEFKVYDDRNILIADRTGRTFVGANQRTAIFEPSLSVGRRIPYLTQFRFVESPVWLSMPADFRGKLVSIEDVTWAHIDSAPKLTARVRNITLFDLEKVSLIALGYDTAGNNIVSSATVVDHIPQGGWYDIVFTWPRPFAEEPTRTEIIPRVNPFVGD